MPLRVLLFTSRMRDVDVLIEGLRQAGHTFHWTQVTTATDYYTWMRADLDVVLVDGTATSMPVWEALRLLRTHQGDVPFIVLNSDRSTAATQMCLLEAQTYALPPGQLHTVGSVVQHACACHTL